MASYRPMTVAGLAAHLSRATDDRIRWKLVWEFLEEYRWEPRVLRRPWFPAELRIQRADALVRAPAAFRKHGVYLPAADLEAA